MPGLDTHIRPLLATVALCALGWAPVTTFGATTLVSQAPSPALGYGDTSAVYNLPGDPGFTFTLDADEQAWEYFHFGRSAEINQVRWFGSDADGNFAVALFAANCVSCNLGSVGTDGNSPVNLLPHNTAYGPGEVGKVALGGGLFAYSINLPSPVRLSADAPFYGLTVVNNYSGKPFQWVASATGDGRHLDYVIGGMRVLYAPGDLAFELADTRIAPVPEPTTYALWLVGLGTLWRWSSRRTDGGRAPGHQAVPAV